MFLFFKLGGWVSSTLRWDLDDLLAHNSRQLMNGESSFHVQWLHYMRRQGHWSFKSHSHNIQYKDRFVNTDSSTSHKWEGFVSCTVARQVLCSVSVKLLLIFSQRWHVFDVILYPFSVQKPAVGHGCQDKSICWTVCDLKQGQVVFCTIMLRLKSSWPAILRHSGHVHMCLY